MQFEGCWASSWTVTGASVKSQGSLDGWEKRKPITNEAYNVCAALTRPLCLWVTVNAADKLEQICTENGFWGSSVLQK